MAIHTQSNTAQYIGNGVTRVFPGPFPVIEKAHVRVFVATDGDGATELTSGFQVLLEADGTCSVEFSTAPAMGMRFAIARLLPLEQPLDLENGGNFNAEEIEGNFDRLVMQVQQVAEEANRSFKFAITHTGELPTAGEYTAQITQMRDESVAAAGAAGMSQANARASELAAGASEAAAKDSENAARASQAAAMASEAAASRDAAEAANSMSLAVASATQAQSSAAASAASEANAAQSESMAQQYSDNIEQLLEDLNINEVLPAGAATGTTSGSRGTAVYAADNDAKSRDKAATPAGVSYLIEQIEIPEVPVATPATASADGASGLARYAADSDKTSRNKAATPAGVAQQVAAATSAIPTVSAGGAATATANGTAGTLQLAASNVTGNNFSLAMTADAVETNLANKSIGTCSTTAATAAKVVVLANFVRRTGSIIGVKFANANTAANATLNVNGTGAADIQCFGGNTTASNNWMGTATTHYFKFDGTVWELLNPRYYANISGSATASQNAKLAGSFSGNKITVTLSGSTADCNCNCTCCG